jgi:hypothetical protein
MMAALLQANQVALPMHERHDVCVPIGRVWARNSNDAVTWGLAIRPEAVGLRLQIISSMQLRRHGGTRGGRRRVGRVGGRSGG